MTKREALNGKPYAGNPHVRFDEGEAASTATSRRGSLLYKLVVVCRAFCRDFMILRWQKMARQYPDINITLIGSAEYVMPANQWGKEKVLGLRSFKEGNFEFIAAQWRGGFWRGGYRVVGLIGKLKELKPDFLYMIGAENADFLFQAIIARALYFRDCKLAMFTMRGTDMPMRDLNFRLRWFFSKCFIDAYFTHSPCCVHVLKRQGRVWQPIYMQTQVGVNTEIFKSDLKARIEIRRKYNVEDDVFLFGTACRIDVRKGLLEMLEALPLPGIKWKFLICGSGPDEQILKNKIKERGIEENVILAGNVPGYEQMNRHFNAMDCFVLMSQTIPKTNVDTYPLVVSQSMASAKPQIVSDSGGLPYEVGSLGWVVHERNVEELHKAMVYAATHPEECKDRGAKLKKRLEHSFALTNLNPLFIATVKDIMSGKYDMSHIDQTRAEPTYTYAEFL